MCASKDKAPLCGRGRLMKICRLAACRSSGQVKENYRLMLIRTLPPKDQELVHPAPAASIGGSASGFLDLVLARQGLRCAFVKGKIAKNTHFETNTGLEDFL